jgi:hypothetical protein
MFITNLAFNSPKTLSLSPFWAGHLMLAKYNQQRLTPQVPTHDWRQKMQEDHRLELLEGDILEIERAEVMALAADAPFRSSEFIKWFEELKNTGPGQNDPLFDWLETSANLQQMTWFIKQEVAGEAGFEDLAALSQVKLPLRAKLEVARNYWDEMGRGKERGMHGPMLARVAEELGLNETSLDEIIPESLALANILIGLAVHPRYAFHSLGALGVIELTAPDRALKVSKGLKRLGISSEGQRYYLLHSTLDKKHSESWNREVLESLVDENPSVATAIAEGALMRLRAGERCFERYRQTLRSHNH